MSILSGICVIVFGTIAIWAVSTLIGYLMYFANIGCKHDFEIIEGWNLMDTRPPLYRCKKCGKEEGL